MESDYEFNSPVLPGFRVGPFRLGMSLYEALGVIKSRSQPQKTRILFSRTSPVDKPVIVDIQSLGVRLRFEPKLQRLYVVDVYDITRLGVSFQGHIVGGKDQRNTPGDSATLKSLYEILGVTHSGFRKRELGKDAYCLQYPGLLIAFRVPEHEPFTGIPLVLSDGTSPRVIRLVIHDFDFPRQQPLGRSGPHAQLAHYLSRAVDAMVSDEKPVEVVFRDTNFCMIIGETCCQDVLTVLGAPTRTHMKQREPIGTKARRHTEHQANNGATTSATPIGGVEAGTDDYFFNYAELGVDVLFDGLRHVVKKVILRSNLIGHPTFGQYDKCAFTVKFVEKTSNANGVNSGAPSGSHGRKAASGLKTAKKPAASSFEDLLTSPMTTPALNKTQERVLSCDDHWLVIAKKLDINDAKPMVHERAEQPFGPCHLFGYRSSVFEVDKASQFLCSITLF